MVTLDVSPPQPVVLLGRGARTVVFSDESDEDLCAWLPLAHTLTRRGYRVALYDHFGDPRADLSAVIGYLRTHGATAVELVGASQGAKASIMVAAKARPAPDAVVSLSAEATLQGTPVAPAAARLDSPVLFVTARHDPYGSTEATRGFYRSAPAAAKRLVVVPGRAHGTALLSQEKVHAAVLHFLADHAPAGQQASAHVPAACPGLTGAHGLWLHTHGGRLEANVVGSGPDGVVFLHEIGSAGMCGFADYAQWLVGHHPGVQAVLVDRCGYGDSTCTERVAHDIAAQTAPAVRWLHAHGARHVTLVGASGGGMDALDAAALVADVDALVDISGDENDTGADDQALARRVTVPSLLAVAPDDPYCSVSSVRALFQKIPAQDKKLDLERHYPGTHGWNLLLDPAGHPLPLARTVAAWVLGQAP